MQSKHYIEISNIQSATDGEGIWNCQCSTDLTYGRAPSLVSI
jgi:hypothetical protein